MKHLRNTSLAHDVLHLRPYNARRVNSSNGELLARHIFQSGYSTVAAVFALGGDSRKRVENFNLDVQHG